MISKRAQKIFPFMVMEILERAQDMERKNEDIIHLEIGEPDLDTPDCIKAAAKRALEDGKTHYTHSLGILELRKAIAEHYKSRYGVDVSSEKIIVTAGTSPALLLVLAALLEPGDEVILPNPHYACYPNFIKFFGGNPIFVPVFEENGFLYETPAVKRSITKSTKAILINSPANPTGAVLSSYGLKALVNLGIYVISDEIYHGLVYGEREHTILEFTDRVFILNGFSKLYAMTGFRVGYIIAPAKFVRPIQKMQQNFFICPNSISQYAAIAALKETQEEVRHIREIYNERRLFMLKHLKALGFSIKVEPKGAFYIFVNAKEISQNSYNLALDILERAKVAVTPGIDFGSNGEGYLRFSYANSLENIAEGMKRLKHYLQCKNVK